MLIIALVLAVIGLAALVTAVVTSNELIAWVCIAASVIGVILLIIDAVRERSRGQAGGGEPQPEEDAAEFDADYPDEPAADEEAETTAAPAETAEEEAAEKDRKTH